MEERDGGFVFFCSQECLQESHGEKAALGTKAMSCDACAKRFALKLAAQVLYAKGRRHYACSMPCRVQLIREAQGMRLGDIAPRAERETRPAHAESTESVKPAATVWRGADARESAAMPAEPHAAATQVPPAPKSQPTGAELLAAAETARPDVGVAQAVSTVPRIAEPPRAAKVSVARKDGGPRRIAVFNHKGGTGKTTTSVSLAAGLASRGHRVLLVDTDSQGNVAVSLGTSCERTLYHVLVMGLRATDAVQQVRPGLDLLPSNETLAAAELYLAGRQNRDRVLAQRMESSADAYDYVVIDCSPSLSLMNQNALCFADSVLIPVACDYLSLVGVRQVIKTVKNVNTLLRHPLQIWGVLPTFYDARAKICNEALDTLRNHFAERCLDPIRATTKLKEAPAQARTIFEHAPGAHGADDYESLVDAVLRGSRAATSPVSESFTIKAQAV